MKKLKAMLFVGIVTTLTLVANLAAALACTSLHYQPELPGSLARKYE